MRRCLIPLLLLLASSFLSGAGPLIISVCPSGCDFTTIQEAIVAAPAGATIQLGPGVYKENLVINKPLNIVGAGADATQIVGQAAGRPVILIQALDQTAEEVKLEGLSLIAAPGYCYCWPVCADGLLVRGSARVRLSEARVSGNGWGGVVALDEARLVLEGVVLQGNHRSQLSLRGRAQAEVRESRFLGGDDAGIALWDQARAIIHGSEIADNRYYGVVLQGSAQARLEEDLIQGNRGDGVNLREAAQAVLVANMIAENQGDGVVLQGEAQASLIRNQITKNRGDGVVLWLGADATLTKNVITANRNGLLLGKRLQVQIQDQTPTGTGALRVRENVVKGNTSWGIAVFSVECGFAGAPEPPRLPLIGEGNEVVMNKRGDLCPADYPWPEGFLERQG